MRIARGVWNEGNPRGEGYEHRLKVGDRPKERISGGYWRIPINGEVCRIYIEEAGQGRDLLLLHTAGSDTRQFYHLLNSDLLASNWRMIAFDMPGHGKSLPPPSWRNKEYRLTGAAYLDTVLAVMECLDLRRPVVFGCSMAGALCLQLAYRYPSRCRAVIACEAADQIPARLTDWLRHPRVDSAEFAPEWIDGLISPLSPDMFRREILWEYSQAAAGVFYGDVAYYSGEFAISSELGRIDTDKCPIYLLTGEYDYSCTPAMSRATAERIKGAHFTEMKGLGHFPMAENPEGFMSYMLPILAEIRTRDAE
ncbi:MAG: alpha/beta hydrolase [Burkholderiales bacterium]|nr:alpha/beta hydrolase [Burkholderiales bacterium]